MLTFFLMNVLYFLTPKSQIKYVTSLMSVRQVLEVMEHYRFTTIPLLDKNGFYVGTLSEGDLLFYLKENPFLSIEEFNKINIMEVKRNRDFLPVSSNTEIGDLIISSTNANFIPVLDDRDKFIGIITRKRIINYLFQLLGDKQQQK